MSDRSLRSRHRAEILREQTWRLRRLRRKGTSDCVLRSGTVMLETHRCLPVDVIVGEDPA
jgi:hypothetical protein